MKFIVTFLQIKLLNPWVRLFIILFYIIGLQIIFNINYLEPSFAFCESARTYCKDGAWIERNLETGDVEYYIPEFYLRFVLEREVVFGGITYVMVPPAQSEVMLRIFEYLLDQKSNLQPDPDFIVIEKIRSILYNMEEREIILREVKSINVNIVEEITPQIILETIASEIVEEPIIGISQLLTFKNYLEQEHITAESRLDMINGLVLTVKESQQDVVRAYLEFENDLYDQRLLEQQKLEVSSISTTTSQVSALDLAIKGSPQDRFKYFFRIYKGCLGLTEIEKMERLLGSVLNMMQSEYYELTLNYIYTAPLNDVIVVLDNYADDERFREFLIEYISCFYTEIVLLSYTDHLDITFERRMEIYNIFKAVISKSHNDNWFFPGVKDHPEILDGDAWIYKEENSAWDDNSSGNEDDN